MMQPFEFSNNTVSLLISVFSVIVGMTYPVLIQAIQRIDEQYRSSRLSKMLMNEPKFKRFQWLVAISIAFAFASIFVMQMVDGHDVLVLTWVSVHSFVTLMLLRATLSLVYLILTYYNPNELLKHIRTLHDINR